jgi:hypothetical protein
VNGQEKFTSEDKDNNEEENKEVQALIDATHIITDIFCLHEGGSGKDKN